VVRSGYPLTCAKHHAPPWNASTFRPSPTGWSTAKSLTVTAQDAVGGQRVTLHCWLGMVLASANNAMQTDVPTRPQSQGIAISRVRPRIHSVRQAIEKPRREVGVSQDCGGDRLGPLSTAGSTRPESPAPTARNWKAHGGAPKSNNRTGCPHVVYVLTVTTTQTKESD
jgi:hypothetical protein